MKSAPRIAPFTQSNVNHLSVVIASHDPCLSRHLSQALQAAAPRMTIDVSSIADLTAARPHAEGAAPHAVLLDPNLPHPPDTSLLTQIHHRFPGAAVVVLATAHDDQFSNADAILTLDDALPHTLVPTLRQALAMRQARRCCERLGAQVESLQERLAQTQASLAEEADQRSRLEALFQSHRADYLTILDSAPAMIWYVDKEGTILRANKRAADSVGLPVTDLIGKDYYRLFPGDAESARSRDRAITNSGLPQCGAIARIDDPDGRPRWLTLDRVPWTDRTGRVTGITIFATDVTAAKLAEDQLRTAKHEIEQINAQLRAAAEQARTYADEAIAANRVKSRFLASVTHEIRTPMNAIIGYSDLLADQHLSHEQKKYLDIIQKSAEHLLALIDDVLDFSKIEAGKLDVRIRPCDPRELLTEVYDLMKHTARCKGLAFDLDIAGLPPALSTDSDRLRQCLMNLVGNALKFTDAGSVRISAAVFGDGDDRLLRIDVSDTGIGIAPDKQEYIFESFAQADTSRAADGRGTGLGLTITKRLMALLGGTVELVSELGKGSTFSLILPVNPTAPCHDTVRAHSDRAADTPPLTAGPS